MAVSLAVKTTDILKKPNLKPVLVVGWNTEAVDLYEHLISFPSLGYDPRAFLCLNPNVKRAHYKNVPIVVGLDKFSETIDRWNISEVLIILSPAEKEFLGQIVKLCTAKGIDYKIVSDAYDEDYGHIIRDIIRDAISREDFGIRRILDLIASIVLLVILFPLFVIVAIAIKIESPGPILYSQSRYGKDGKIFKVYKFRSMVADAEKRSGPVWASKNDPRVTRVGKFMRKTRIDELPQLINIIKGDMSFIGPRPERPFFADNFRKKIPLYMNRLKVKPGITGLAQVTVGYDETLEDVKEKVARDLEYINQAGSLKMNLYILFKTIGAVLKGEGQ